MSKVRVEVEWIFADVINYFKSFCLRDRGRLGNEGQPISLKIGTQIS